MRLMNRWLLGVGLFGLASMAAVLTGLGKLPRLAGWSAVAVAAGAALTTLLLTPAIEWIRQASASQINRKAMLDGLRLTGAIIDRPLEKYDPIRDLGVHPPMELKEGPRLPPYVARTVDKELDRALAHGGLVLVEGNSAAGKTRTAYEALRRNSNALGWRSVIVPKDGVALRRLVESGYKLRRTVVWLDDFEAYLSPDGIDEGLIRALCPSDQNDVVLFATLRSRVKSTLGVDVDRADVNDFVRDIRKVLAAATTIRLDRQLNQDERLAASKFRSDSRIAAALDNSAGFGLAEHLAAGPAAVDYWQTGRDGANEVGAALISAGIDFRRAGYLAPIPRAWLEEVFTVYLSPRSRQEIKDSHLEEAFAWATKEIHGASACLIASDGLYEAFDYLVDYVQGQTTATPEDAESPFEYLESIPAEVWHELRDQVLPGNPQYLSCVTAASVSTHPGMALQLHADVDRGHLHTADLNNQAQLLALARNCVRMRLCVACQIVSLGLDLGLLLRTLLDIVEPVLGEPSQPKDERQLEALIILNDLGEEGGPAEPETKLNEVASELDPDRLYRLGLVLLRDNRTDSGLAWIKCAAMLGHANALAEVGRPPQA